MPIIATPTHQPDWEIGALTGEQAARSKPVYVISTPARRSGLVQWLFEKGMRWSESFYASPGAVEVVSDIYSFREQRVIQAYLEIHREVLPVLVEAYGHIQAEFGPGTPVVLNVISEPTNRQGTELFALISTSLPVEQALTALRRLDEEWWLDVPEHTTGSLNFDIAFV